MLINVNICMLNNWQAIYQGKNNDYKKNGRWRYRSAQQWH
ncbi:hypothetical protein CIT292_08317 [Citrobacter youngae ATCC 29220]|uniref:Uncharacterized protein n=1 Tax=Citrobacter youngae ATCC 29220 TaxID=500640 RepID=D4BCV2_9ENTR|nr:hypothetical protein CIT292_08317 [Citrobacter youngae ATCC 29220]